MERGKKKSFRYSWSKICILFAYRASYVTQSGATNTIILVTATLIPFLSTTREVLNRETSRNNCRCGFVAVLRPINYIPSHQQFLHSFFTSSLPVLASIILGDLSSTKRQHFSSFSPFRIYTNLYFFPCGKKQTMRI